MKKTLLWMVLLIMGAVCHAEDITVRYQGSIAKVEQKVKDSVQVMVNGAKVCVESQYRSHKLTLRLTGRSDDGQLVLKTAGKAKVKLDRLTLTSQEGAPLWLKNKKKVEIVAVEGTQNTLTVTACNDTANHKAAVIWSKDKVQLSGKGTLNVVATGDTIQAWSQVGSPEEGLDCDFSPIAIEGGTVFTVGGGMGEMPSVPNEKTAKQPTALLIAFDIEKDEPVRIFDAQGTLIYSIVIPFSLRRSASLVTCPAFRLGATYTVKTKGCERTFIFKDPFTAVR